MTDMKPRLKNRITDPLISLIIPVFNEAGVVDLFVDKTSSVMEQAALRFEYVFVNDGSTDGTLDRLIELSCKDERIRIINLSRNFGKEAALSAGIDHVAGDVLVPLDVDLQDPPDLIPEFLEKWREGYDIVYGVRRARNSDAPLKRLTAGLFYKLFNKVSPTPIPDNAGDFRLIDKRAIQVLRQLPERNRFMKGLFAWVGFSSVGVPYERPERVAGRTKWNYWKLWNFAIDGIVSFSTVPLRIWAYVGVSVSLFSFLYALFIITKVLIYGIDVPGYASLLVVVLFLGGVQLMSLGIIGEYLGRLFLEVKGRPVYVIEDIYQAGRGQSDSV